MTGPESPDLSALVSARLCHDLISPMGAIGNGLELMQMSGGRTGAEVNLISESLDNALAKLKFFRVAFGPADPQARQSFEEAAQITDAAFQGRFTVTWQAEGKDMPRPMARMLYLAILCLEKSLPMGGELRINSAEDAARMSVEGRRTSPPELLWAHVRDGRPVPDLRSDGVQFALLRRALDGAQAAFDVRFTESGATLDLRAVIPQPA
jgi:histidine phosphotransferase ChpT